MKLTAKLQTESSTIGTLPLTDDQPRSAGQVLYREFGVATSTPLRGGTPLNKVIELLEANPSMSAHLKAARRNLGKVLEGENESSLRALRMAAGLSQAKLADRAGATQSYIARVEAGTLDPGTDMLARLAEALEVSEESVFSAIRTQRRQQNG
jgi:DNA-binding XRE family transcriptional regulator